MADRVQFRRDTAANWSTYNPILLEGELGFVLGTQHYKLGDGVNAWNDLPLRGFNGNITSEILNDENSVPSGAAISHQLLNNYFIGNGSVFSSCYINLMRGRKYRIILNNPDWARDNTGTNPTQWYFSVECTVSGSRRTLIYVQRGGTVDKTYEFTVPNDYDEGSLFVGGRANSGVKVLFNLYDVTEIAQTALELDTITKNIDSVYSVEDAYINETPEIVSNSNWNISELIPFNSNESIQIKVPADFYTQKFGIYNADRELISSYSMLNNRVIAWSEGVAYASMSVRKEDAEQFKLFKDNVLVFQGIQADSLNLSALDKRIENLEEETTQNTQDITQNTQDITQNTQDIVCLTQDIIHKDNYYFGASIEVSNEDWYEGIYIPYDSTKRYIIECPDDIIIDSPQKVAGLDADGLIVDYKGIYNGRQLSFNPNTVYISLSVRKADAEKFKLYKDGVLIYQGIKPDYNIPILAKRVDDLEDQLTVNTIYSRNNDKLPLLFAASNKNNRLQVLIATDAHEDWGALQNAVDFANQCNNIQALFVMGDCTGSATPSLATFERYNEIINSCTKPVFCIAGNHDCGYDWRLRYTALEDKICEYITEPTYQHLETEEYVAGKAYYYHDFTAQKIRAIFLYEYDETISLVPNAYWEAVAYDSTKDDYTIGAEYVVDDIVNFGLYTANSFKCIQAHTASADNEIKLQGYRGYRFIGQTQMAWLVATMLSTPADYNIVICSHIPASADYNTVVRNSKFSSKFINEGNGFNGMAADYLGILANAFNNGGNGTLRVAANNTFGYINTQEAGGEHYAYEVEYDFSGKNSGTKFMCFLSGHTHVDVVLKNSFNQYGISPTFTTATTRQFPTNDVPRSSNPKDLAYDALTVVAFDTDHDGIVLTRVGTTATTDGYLRDVDRIDLTQ